MSKKLNLILTGILIAISLPALASSKNRECDWDSEREFLSYDRLAKQSAVAATAGGAIGYYLSKDKGAPTKATIAFGLGALVGWGVYKWQHRKTLAGAQQYVEDIAAAVDTDGLVGRQGMNAKTAREIFLLSQWDEAVDRALKLQNKIDDKASTCCFNYAKIRIFKISAVYKMTGGAKAQDSVRAYGASIAGRFESLMFVVNGGYPSRTTASAAE